MAAASVVRQFEDLFQVSHVVAEVASDVAYVLCVSRAFYGEPSLVLYLLQRLPYRRHVDVRVVAQRDAVCVRDVYLADASCAECLQLFADELCRRLRSVCLSGFEAVAGVLEVVVDFYAVRVDVVEHLP